MSLIVTSNTARNDLSQYSTTGINRPYSYINNLQGTFKIPKNAEIAVQSVKINKTGNQAISPANSRFGFYIGRERDEGGVPPLLSAQTASAAFTNAFQRDLVERNMTPEDIAREFQSAARKNLFHPLLLENSSSAVNPGLSCIVKRNASDVDFLGYTFDVTIQSASRNASHISQTWINAEYNDPTTAGVTPTATHFAIQNNNVNANEYNSFIGTDYPLSLANGSFNCSLNGVNGSQEWQIGLTRATRTELGGVPQNLSSPTYFVQQGFDDVFFDFVVTAEENALGKYEIKVYQAVPFDENGIGNPNPDSTLRMIEHDYRNKPVSGSNNPADYYQKALNDIRGVKFVIQNERVYIYLDVGGVETLIVDGSKDYTAGQCLKPVNMSCRFLYPKLYLKGQSTLFVEDFYGVDIKDHKYGGVINDNVDVKSYDNNRYHDWWATMVNIGKEDFVRFWETNADGYIMNGVDYNGDAVTQLGMAGDALDSYKPIFIFQPDGDYDDADYWYGSPNTALTMGFPDRSPVDKANVETITGSNAFKYQFDSDDVPELKSVESMFIRLKNMTFNSVNLAKGANSKIIYHLPAFSTGTERRVGSLYFEPSSRVYLDLNNSEELNLSTMEIEFVRSDETLADNLIGKSVVVFHVRQKK
jgi:hypothetical protein